jgi:hypothetical protein
VQCRWDEVALCCVDVEKEATPPREECVWNDAAPTVFWKLLNLFRLNSVDGTCWAPHFQRCKCDCKQINYKQLAKKILFHIEEWGMHGAGGYLMLACFVRSWPDQCKKPQDDDDPTDGKFLSTRRTRPIPGSTLLKHISVQTTGLSARSLSI